MLSYVWPYRLKEHTMNDVWQEQIAKDIGKSVGIDASDIKLVVAAGSVVETIVVR